MEDEGELVPLSSFVAQLLREAQRRRAENAARESRRGESGARGARRESEGD